MGTSKPSRIGSASSAGPSELLPLSEPQATQAKTGRSNRAAVRLRRRERLGWLEIFFVHVGHMTNVRSEVAQRQHFGARYPTFRE
jgi:hypothetical protein